MIKEMFSHRHSVLWFRVKKPYDISLNILYRRILKDRLGHTSGSPFHAQRYLFNQIHCSDWFTALYNDCFRSID